MNTKKLIQTLTATAIFLVATSALATGQDTGYPWYGDIQEKDVPTVSKPANVIEVPVLPSGQDTGKPWFADIKDDDKSVTKRVTIFKSPSINLGEDSGYPWYADIEMDDPAHSQSSTRIQ